MTEFRKYVELWASYHILNLIPILRKLGNIHWNYHYHPVEDNVSLETFSKEKYDEIVHGTTPSRRGIKYHVASWVLDHGNIVFGNYSRYEQTCHLLSFDRVDEAKIEYLKLPRFYQRLVRETFDETTLTE